MNRPTANALQRLLYRLIGFVWFNRITLPARDRRVVAGPTLYLGLHRNGVVDGIAYLAFAPASAFLVSAQLHRFVFGRALFPGIAVARRKDRDRGIEADNAQAIERCVSHLRSGADLFVLPEGTSTLGPRHLPFKSGAADITVAALRRGVTLTLVPLAIHYECAWELQGRVEIHVGDAFTFSPADAPSSDVIATRIDASLERTGVNVDSETELRLMEMLAYTASRSTELGYSVCLKRLEAGIPPALRDRVETLHAVAQQSRAWRYHGVPLVPNASVLPQLGIWIALAPLVAMGWIINLPPLTTAYVAARVFADHLNVVAFWRIVVGVPTAVLWFSIVVIALARGGHTFLAAAFLAISLCAVRLLRSFKILSVTVHNGLRAPQLRQPMQALQRELATWVGRG